jgi:hypothetical protein
MDKQKPTEIIPLTPAPQAQAKAEVEKMTFDKAMKMIMNGKQVKRLSWSPAKDYGCLKDGWLTIFTKNAFHIWKVNDGDTGADDWVVNEKK